MEPDMKLAEEAIVERPRKRLKSAPGTPSAFMNSGQEERERQAIRRTRHRPSQALDRTVSGTNTERGRLRRPTTRLGHEPSIPPGSFLGTATMLDDQEIEKMARKYVGGAISPKALDPGGSAPFVVRSKNREEKAPRPVAEDHATRNNALGSLVGVDPAPDFRCDQVCVRNGSRRVGPAPSPIFLHRGKVIDLSGRR